MCQNELCPPRPFLRLLILFFFVNVFLVIIESRPQLLNSVSTTGLLVGKGSEVKAASVPFLPEPMMGIHSHSAPVSPSELNFNRRKRKCKRTT